MANHTTTVQPAELRPALQAKLSDATWQCHHMREQEQPRLTTHLDLHSIVAHFLPAARGVWPTAQTFAKGQGVDFNAWYQNWLNRLTADECDSRRQLRADRVAQEHGAGADLISYEIDVTGDPSIILHQGIPGVERPRSTKGGVRFAAYPNRPASAVMAEWLALAQRFVADFVRDHAHLLP